MYTCVDAYEEMTHKHTHKLITNHAHMLSCTCAHACIHVPTCTRTRSHTRTVRLVSLNFRDQSRLGQVFAPRIVLDDFSRKRFLACTRESKSGFGVSCVCVCVDVCACVCVCACVPCLVVCVCIPSTQTAAPSSSIMRITVFNSGAKMGPGCVRSVFVWCLVSVRK